MDMVHQNFVFNSFSDFSPHSRIHPLDVLCHLHHMTPLNYHYSHIIAPSSPFTASFSLSTIVLAISARGQPPLGLYGSFRLPVSSVSSW
jgi:hypothetical protein